MVKHPATSTRSNRIVPTTITTTTACQSGCYSWLCPQIVCSCSRIIFYLGGYSGGDGGDDLYRDVSGGDGGDDRGGGGGGGVFLDKQDLILDSDLPKILGFLN